MEIIYGLLGEKLQHSLSPQIHSYIYNELNLNASYKLFEIPKNLLKDTLESLKQSNIKGLNVTIPYKVELLKYIDKLSPEAKKIGSINTIAFHDSLIGYNTDYFGFGSLLTRENISIKGSKVTVLGSGGAARAVIQYLIDNDANDILLVSRSDNNELKIILNKQIQVITYTELPHYKQRDLIINCTPCGMHPNIDDSPIDIEILYNYKIALDLIYNPRETLFIRNAKQYGLKTANGLYMLVAQATAAYEFWSNIVIEKKLTDKIYQLLCDTNNQRNFTPKKK